WFALFCMWIYFVPAVATSVFGGEPGTEAYQRGTEWGGLCFSVYNGTAFIFSFVLLALVRRFQAKLIHRACLIAGGAGLVLAVVTASPWALLACMLLVGIAWASILSMPYAMLSNVIAAEQMGFYMGVFNFFIVLPQILASAGLGLLMTHVLGGKAMNAVLLGGLSLGVAAWCTFLLRSVDDGRS
ncbi:MAG TPA: MFS transporter, partial [Bacteroidota bacterium]|nr:MFS transporter [Bacteroidota bacterium]